jgi:hypothetical protein
MVSLAAAEKYGKIDFNALENRDLFAILSGTRMYHQNK